MDKKTIDAMPMSQAILVAMVHDYKARRDEIFKWAYLPVNEWPSLQTLTRNEQELLQRPEMFSLAKLLLPAVGRVRYSNLRLERETNLLRAIEALRWHAALTGELPHLWKDITAVPVPRDPWTGEPFRYQRTGDNRANRSTRAGRHDRCAALAVRDSSRKTKRHQETLCRGGIRPGGGQP